MPKASTAAESEALAQTGPNAAPSPATAPSLIKLQEVAFDQPAFRKLGSIKVNIAPRLTLIAGRNGVGKSTILALIAGTSGVARGKYKTYLGNRPNVKAEEILRLSYERDFVKNDAEKAHVILTYTFGDKRFQKKENVSGSEARLRVVPRNEPKGPRIVNGVNIPADGKVPLPTIYLGMMRMIPFGETDPNTVDTSQVKMHPDDFGIYEDFTNRIIHTGMANGAPQLTKQVVRGTRKQSLYPRYDGYESMSVSLGQDSLSAIATALASFNKLRREMGRAYHGGLLVIDELDAGFHPHAQVELLEELKSKARQLDIQIVATTHSLTVLEHAHQDIYREKRSGEPLDQINYLKAGNPIELLDASDYRLIEDDMHMRITTPVPVAKVVKVYVEDDEAHLFLSAILTKARKKEIETQTGFKLNLISARVGCSNLVGLIKADEYFTTVVVVLDADTTGVNAGGARNVVRLPADPCNQKKQSPEILIKNMCEQMLSDSNAYPASREMLRSVNADTTYLRKYVLDLQRGETQPSKPIEEDRDLAKKWFNARLEKIKQMKLVEGWVCDNEAGVRKFITDLASAVCAAAGTPTFHKKPKTKQKSASLTVV